MAGQRGRLTTRFQDSAFKMFPSNFIGTVTCKIGRRTVEPFVMIREQAQDGFSAHAVRKSIFADRLPNVAPFNGWIRYVDLDGHDRKRVKDAIFKCANRHAPKLAPRRSRSSRRSA